MEATTGAAQRAPACSAPERPPAAAVFTTARVPYIFTLGIRILPSIAVKIVPFIRVLLLLELLISLYATWIRCNSSCRRALPMAKERFSGFWSDGVITKYNSHFFISVLNITCITIFLHVKILPFVLIRVCLSCFYLYLGKNNFAIRTTIKIQTLYWTIYSMVTSI